ncbi:acyl-protein synthetase [Catenovulum sp. 2E275]|uniref:LuxE/PaaK family acyltransferase n=1 Tax=Catenovulum sp. 2E275 TaxID=2980497 RepID=UPI0021D0EAAE|nr:acyl-protein synthetase [Catenovulum sp. 2E275]MCU4674750.1 acyl-protein synthetase [Catenovulum sp. 2E275]
MFEYQSDILTLPVYGLKKAEKQAFLNQTLLDLSRYHYQHSAHYKRLIDCSGFEFEQKTAQDLIPLAARLFKDFELSSIESQNVFRQMRSSGTSGQASKIVLDANSAKRQSQILVKILQAWLGKQRRPMLLIDSASTIKIGGGMSARAAGLQGLSFFGRNHCYALDDNMQLDVEKVTEFAEQFKHEPVLIFGFTFIVWQQFIQALKAKNIQLSLDNAILIHGGGWKKMQEQAVSDELFREQIKMQLGNVSVHDYYGMVEQTGTIYMQCEHGYLHTPVWSDVLIRNPQDLTLVKQGDIGLIQVNSVLATSYPGHCILTEDLGRIVGEDDCQCGRLGKYFTVHGRVPKAQVRGCSDTFA